MLKLAALLCLPLVASCATGPRYAPATADTAWIYGKIVNPATWLTAGELHSSVLSVDGTPAGSGRSVEVDQGPRQVEVMGVGPGNFSVFGTLTLRVEKDRDYYVRCRRAEGGYRFDAEVEDDQGTRTAASAPARRRR
jgi:hypothetical protein